jgi:peptidyl-tRNA hydrolase, PTH2 family
MKSKQVIVVRSDLRNTKGHKVRTGKLISQGAHACMKAVFDKSVFVEDGMFIELPNESALWDWIKDKFTKVCVSVDSEEELFDIVNKAQAAGLPCALITDSGLTEFGGVPTRTCCAIGPAWSDEVDAITGHLKLL